MEDRHFAHYSGGRRDGYCVECFGAIVSKCLVIYSTLHITNEKYYNQNNQDVFVK